MSDIQDQIKEQGDLVRKLKAAKEPKEKVYFDSHMYLTIVQLS